ncbi:hypothetical protein BDP27DRAFT_1451579 [Rhodocollybia butyracea]|uniref:Uncharacterized protein n=1 Tax=Rhodocollybia butyracea TaxID=206335 RepID=A0A9P5U0S0_9AGAR|nr:hypothetical protein BDP27DRAFT_1451579 [Rhodocollybia butyracea]
MAIKSAATAVLVASSESRTRGYRVFAPRYILDDTEYSLLAMAYPAPKLKRSSAQDLSAYEDTLNINYFTTSNAKSLSPPPRHPVAAPRLPAPTTMPTVLNTIKKEAHAIQPDPTRVGAIHVAMLRMSIDPMLALTLLKQRLSLFQLQPQLHLHRHYLTVHSVFVTMDAVGNTDFSDNDNDGEFSAFDESSISPISLTTPPTPLSSIGIVDVPVYSPAYDSAHMLGLKGMKENEGFARYRFGWI